MERGNPKGFLDFLRGLPRPLPSQRKGYMDAIPTQNYLKSIFRFDQELGRFFWIVPRGKKIKPGTMPGHLKRDGYRYIKIDGKPFLEHRLVWLYFHGEFPVGQIDHVNHCRDDNRLKNLRVVSEKENHKNRQKNINNTSGVMGIYWDKQSEKWYAQIKVDCQSKRLGRFKDFFEAVCARKSSELKNGYHENHGSKPCYQNERNL